MFKSSKCYSGGNRHNFQPRYSEIPSQINKVNSTGMDGDELKSLLTLKVYNGDICSWCGKVIKKD